MDRGKVPQCPETGTKFRPTPTGNQDYSEVFSSEIAGTVEYSCKAGFGIGVAVEGTYNRATGDTDFTIGLAAGLAGSVSGTIGADGSVGITGWSGGVGGIFGVFVDTPFGGVGAAAEGTAGLTSDDGIVHVGAIGQASAGILTIDAAATAQAGVSLDFGSLAYQEAMTPNSDSARVPQSVIDEINGGLGVRIPHGHDFNQLDQLAEIGRTSPSAITHNADYGSPCFAKGTPILTPFGEVPIEALKVGDRVMSFDPHSENGRGRLVAKEITKLFLNTTPEFMKLTWQDGGSRELITTPGHHFLREDGQFGPISEIAEDGTVRVILQSGEVATCDVEHIVYSVKTAGLFDQAQSYGYAGSGSLAFKTLGEWESYNFEVDECHTYVANGIRVHNDCIYVSEYGGGPSELLAFDGLGYIASYADLIDAFGDDSSAGTSHFINYGANEGRSITFDGLSYIASYGDLINAFGANSASGALHYINHGFNEGRVTTFDGLEYIASYTDLINHFGTDSDGATAHFINHGFNEGRVTTFDGLEYIASYIDLMNLYGPNAEAGATHYIKNGLAEGRVTTCSATI